MITIMKNDRNFEYRIPEYQTEIYDEIFIKITPEDSNKVGDIGNMVYDQFVGHKDYIDNNVVLNIDNGTDVRIWIEKDSCKFPIFFLSKFYKPFS